MSNLPTVKKEIDNGEIIQGLVYLHGGCLKQGYEHIVKHFFDDPEKWYAQAISERNTNSDNGGE